ncbi:hypothetical protein [Streptomyces niveus]|uniref:hypothetical protein n=1 Tax=Streptomyces niveus TaxID=193462 RepID=UPI00386EB7F5
MKQRIEFTAAVDVYTDEPLTHEEAEGWVETALTRGDKHASYVSWLKDVVRISDIPDDAE